MLFIQKLCQALNEKGIDYAVVGGHAVALHGAPRGTVDIDFVVRWSAATLVAIERCFLDLGLQSRQPLVAADIYQFRDEYVQKRGLISWNFFNPHDLTESVDVVVNYDLNPEDVRHFEIGEVRVPVLSLCSLIEMKSNSERQQDLFDVEALRAIKRRVIQ